MENAVEIEKLSCKVGHNYLLKDINWQVKSGEKWVVFGMNGCGKTTLLSIISGFRTFSSGNLQVLGERYKEENVLDLRKKIGFVSNSFFDKILSQEAVLDIVLAGKFGTIGIDGDINNYDIVKAKNLLRELRLKDKINRPFNLLSKGERQNVLIARALMSKPELLVLDEPGTGLDVFAREYMLSTVKDLAENTNMTIIYVTHYVEEILENFNNCLLMKDGKIFDCCSTTDIFTTENISKLLDHEVNISFYKGRINLRLEVGSNIRKMIR